MKRVAFGEYLSSGCRHAFVIRLVFVWCWFGVGLVLAPERMRQTKAGQHCGVDRLFCVLGEGL